MRQMIPLLIVAASFAPSVSAQAPVSGQFVPSDQYDAGIKSYQLHNAQVNSVVEILNEQFPSLVKFSADPSTNTLYARVPKEAETEVREFIDLLEQNAAKNAAASAAWKAVEQQQRRRNTAGIMFSDIYAVEGLGDTKATASNHDVSNASSEPAPDLMLLDRSKSLSISAPSPYEAAEREAAKLADRYRREKKKDRLSEAALNQLKAKVREQVAAAFDLRQRKQRKDLAKATAQLDAIRERLEARKRSADQIVQRRVEDLISGVDLSWLSEADRAENEALMIADRAAQTPDKISNEEKGPQLALAGSSGDNEARVEAIPELDTIIIRGRKEVVDNVVELLDSAKTAPREEPIQGEVLRLNDQTKTILLSLGTSDGLTSKALVDAFRDGKQIGRLEVISVAPKNSISRVLTIKGDAEIAVGDEVRVVDRRSENASP